MLYQYYERLYRYSQLQIGCMKTWKYSNKYLCLNPLIYYLYILMHLIGIQFSWIFNMIIYNQFQCAKRLLLKFVPGN